MSILLVQSTLVWNLYGQLLIGDTCEIMLSLYSCEIPIGTNHSRVKCVQLVNLYWYKAHLWKPIQYLWRRIVEIKHMANSSYKIHVKLSCLYIFTFASKAKYYAIVKCKGTVMALVNAPLDFFTKLMFSFSSNDRKLRNYD